MTGAPPPSMNGSAGHMPLPPTVFAPPSVSSPPPPTGFTPPDQGAGAAARRPRYPGAPVGVVPPALPAAGAIGVAPGAVADGSAAQHRLSEKMTSLGDPSNVFDLMSTSHVLPSSPVQPPLPELPESHRRRNVSAKCVRSTINRVPIQQAVRIASRFLYTRANVVDVLCDTPTCSMFVVVLLCVQYCFSTYVLVLGFRFLTLMLSPLVRITHLLQGSAQEQNPFRYHDLPVRPRESALYRVHCHPTVPKLSHVHESVCHVSLARTTVAV